MNAHTPEEVRRYRCALVGLCPGDPYYDEAFRMSDTMPAWKIAQALNLHPEQIWILGGPIPSADAYSKWGIK